MEHSQTLLIVNYAAIETCIYVYWLEYHFSFLWSIYPGVKLHSHMVVLYSSFSGPAKLISTAAEPTVPSHQQCKSVPISLSPHQHLLFPFFFSIIIAIQVDGFDRHFPID